MPLRRHGWLAVSAIVLLVLAVVGAVVRQRSVPDVDPASSDLPSDRQRWETALQEFDRQNPKPWEIKGQFKVSFPVRSTWLADLESRSERIRTLILDGGVIDDDAVATLSKLTKLRHLRLRLSPISDAGLRELSKLPNLEILNLPQCRCTDQGLLALRDLADLRQLRIGSKLMTAAAAESIAQLSELRSLHTIGVPLDDDGLKLIAAMENLESLYVDESQVSADGWDWLFENRSDLHVHVNQRHLDRDPQLHD